MKRFVCLTGRPHTPNAPRDSGDLECRLWRDMMARARKRKGLPVHGWLAVDKPVEMTSTQIVGRLKRLFNAQKAGHGGTLDPLADGVLPIAFGEATKTAQWAMDCDKEYVFTISWGASTDTQDREGAIIRRSDARPDAASIETILANYIGTISQVPPKYSAIKVDGARAYDLARGGEAFELKARDITVYETELVSLPDRDHAIIRVCSGKGFYVRSFARDLAADLGVEGHVSKLRRTRVGMLDEASTVTLEDIERCAAEAGDLEGLLKPIETVLDGLPSVAINPAEAADLRHGREILLLPHIIEQWRADQAQLAMDGGDDRTTLAMCDETAVAIGEVRVGKFKPQRVFQL